MSFDRYIASVSFGKDSLAMVLLILERGLPLDEVVFYDTGMEFKAIYDTRDRVLPILYDHGVKYTELRPPRPFLFDMLEKPVSSKKNGLHQGSPQTNRSAFSAFRCIRSHPWRSSASPKPTPWPVAMTAASSGRKTESGFMTFWTACPVGAVRIRT